MANTNLKNANRYAYLGSLGSYSHYAGNSLFQGLEGVGKPNFRSIISAVEEEEVDVGILPIENSITGRIPEVHQLIWQMNCSVCHEIIKPINHCLVGNLPLTSVRNCKGEGFKILSHPQGFLQCKDYIEKNLSNAELVPQSDTASGVQLVSERKEKALLAIGSEFAADLYGGQIIAQNINQSTSNFTRFVGITATSNWLPSGNENLSILMIKVSNSPNALAETLNEFGSRGVNLVRLEMIGANQELEAPSFLVELAAGIKSSEFFDSLNAIENEVVAVKIIGSCIASTDRSFANGFIPIN